MYVYISSSSLICTMVLSLTISTCSNPYIHILPFRSLTIGTELQHRRCAKPKTSVGGQLNKSTVNMLLFLNLPSTLSQRKPASQHVKTHILLAETRRKASQQAQVSNEHHRSHHVAHAPTLPILVLQILLTTLKCSIIYLLPTGISNALVLKNTIQPLLKPSCSLSVVCTTRLLLRVVTPFLLVQFRI